MTEKNEPYEKIPDLVIDSRKVNKISKAKSLKVISESEPVNISTIMESFSEEEKTQIRQNLAAPSTLRIELPQTLVDFENYKGDIPELFNDLSALFPLINKWKEVTPLEINKNFPEKDINQLLNKFAYIPNNKYLGNVLEILSIILENGNLELGSVMDTEIVFQGFKRIYNQRVQALLLPFLFTTYDLDKKLLPIKKIAWQLLNKNARNYHAALIMNDIQKSNVRIKKAQELLTQEKYNLEQKFEQNIDLLLVLTSNNNVFYPIYKVYKESLNNPELNIEKFLISAYGLDNINIKPLSQQLLIFKIGKTGENVTNKIIRWPGKNSEPQFKQYLCECYSDILSSEDIFDKNFQIVIREIVFSTMDIARNRAWSTIEIIKDMVFAILSALNLTDSNKLKIISYYLGSEVISGVLKIKYRIDEAVQGLAKGIVYLIYAAIECENNPRRNLSGLVNKKEFFTNKINYKTISEYIYSGIWDTALEIYPNFLTIEKHADLFTTTMKSETRLLKAKLQEEESRIFERNLLFS